MHKKRPYLWFLRFVAPFHTLCSLPLSGFTKRRPEIIGLALYEPSWTPTLLRCTRLFPGGSVSKESACDAGDSGDAGSIPGLRGAPKEGNGNAFQYFCLENPVDKGAWWVTVHGVTKSWTWLSTTLVCMYKAVWKRQWHPTPVLLLGESHGGRSLVGYIPWGRKESDTTERLHFHDISRHSWNLPYLT